MRNQRDASNIKNRPEQSKRRATQLIKAFSPEELGIRSNKVISQRRSIRTQSFNLDLEKLGAIAKRDRHGESPVPNSTKNNNLHTQSHMSELKELYRKTNQFGGYKAHQPLKRLEETISEINPLQQRSNSPHLLYSE